MICGIIVMKIDRSFKKEVIIYPDKKSTVFDCMGDIV